MNFKKLILIIIIILILLFLGYKFFKPIKTEQTVANSTNNTIQNVTENIEPTLAEKKLLEMTLEEKIGQLFIVRPEAFEVSTEINSNTRNYFKSISCRWNCLI